MRVSARLSFQSLCVMPAPSLTISVSSGTCSALQQSGFHLYGPTPTERRFCSKSSPDEMRDADHLPDAHRGAGTHRDRGIDRDGVRGDIGAQGLGRESERDGFELGIDALRARATRAGSRQRWAERPHNHSARSLSSRRSP